MTNSKKDNQKPASPEKMQGKEKATASKNRAQKVETKELYTKKRGPIAREQLKPNGNIKRGVDALNDTTGDQINLPQEQSKFGYYATALGIGLGSYILYKIATANEDDEKLQKKIAKREGKLESEEDATKRAALLKEIEQLKANQQKLREQLNQREQERLQQQTLGSKERKAIQEQLGDVVRDYKKVLQQLHKGKAFAAIKSVIGPTLGLFLVSYTSSASARRFAQTHFGVPDLTKLKIYGNKKLAEILRDSINRIKAAPTATEKKRVLDSEIDRVSGILDSLKDMKQYRDLIAENTKKKVNLDSYVINKVAPLYAKNLLEMHAKSKNKKIKIEGTSDEEQKQFYQLATYLKENWHIVESVFERESKKYPKIYNGLKLEDISVRTALGLLFIEKLDTPFYKRIGNIYAARARFIGVPPKYLNFKHGLLFKLRKYNGYLGWGMEAHYARYMDHLERKQRRYLQKYAEITAQASENTEVKKIAQQIEAIENKMITAQNKGNAEEFGKLNSELDELKKQHQKTLTEALTPKALEEYKMIHDAINVNRREAAKLAIDSAALMAKRAEERIKRIDEDIKYAKEQSKNPTSGTKKQWKEHYKKLLQERTQIVATVTEQKHRALREMNRTMNFDTGADGRMVFVDEGTTFRMGTDDKFIKYCHANEGLINKLLTNPNHEFWQRNSRIMGYSAEEFIVHAQRALTVSKSYSSAMVDGILKGKYVAKLPLIGKANKWFMRGAKGLMVAQAAGDVRQGRYLAVAEMGASLIPIAGDLIDIAAAFRGKDWEGRRLKFTDQMIRGGLGFAGLAANLLSFGLAGTAAKAALKGAKLGLKSGEGILKTAVATAKTAKLAAEGTKSAKLAGAGLKMKRAIGVATYPMIGFAMYDTSKHVLNKLHAYDIMKKTGVTAYEASAKTLKILAVLHKMLTSKYNIDPTKGFVEKPQVGKRSIERLTQV